MTPDLDLKALRKQLKTQRAQLSAWQQHQTALRLVRSLRFHPVLKCAKHIALYWPIKGEADIRLIRNYLQPYQKLYLPVLASRPAHTLQWLEWTPHTRFKLNRFNIPEPLPGTNIIQSKQLDVVLMPLVGFGDKGSRLGMGGGFYDRSFAHLQRSPRPLKPYLIGIAYEFQYVPDLRANTWDVPLNNIVTEIRLRGGR